MKYINVAKLFKKKKRMLERKKAQRDSRIDS